MPNNEVETVALKKELLEQNKLKFENEISILNSLSTTWGWSPDTLLGGILLERIPSSQTPLNISNFNVEGDTAVLNVDVKLVNGNSCYFDDSLYLIVD